MAPWMPRASGRARTRRRRRARPPRRAAPPPPPSGAGTVEAVACSSRAPAAPLPSAPRSTRRNPRGGRRRCTRLALRVAPLRPSRRSSTPTLATASSACRAGTCAEGGDRRASRSPGGTRGRSCRTRRLPARGRSCGHCNTRVAPIGDRVHNRRMPRTTKRSTVSRDPEIVALVATFPDYPGPVALLDAADRAWLRERGVSVPDRAPPVPLHEAARQARIRRGEESSQ